MYQITIFIKRFVKKFFPFWIINRKIIFKTEKVLHVIGYNEGPEHYNCNKEKLLNFYLSDALLGFQFYSYTEKKIPHRINWNRSNPSLSNHFYGHLDIFNTIGNPKKKFAIIVETEAIEPTTYKKILRHPKLASKFDAIFTHSYEILQKYSNAYFIPAGGLWIDPNLNVTDFKDNPLNYKPFGVSMVSSNKKMNKLHSYRIKIAKQLKFRGLVDTYGTFDNGEKIDISESLLQYKYSIIIENTVTPYCFTEKILNCFSTFTIPIYLGATKISDFFNTDGIIQFSEKHSIDNLMKLLTKCDEKFYLANIDAIIDNYERSRKYTCQEDYIVENYGYMFLDEPK